MKNLISLPLAALLTLSAVGGLKASDNDRDVIHINSAKFTSPLIEKWAAEYVRQNPDIQIKWVDKNSKEIDLTPIASDEAEPQPDKDVAYVGRYALLPITTKENPLYEQITRKKFSRKELRNLFFAEDLLAGDEKKKDPLQSRLTVYSGNGSASGAFAFASFFGYSTSNFRGKRISGDDIYLLNAIQKDSTGITFNNLSYIFDLTNRHLKDEIALLPLDIKKEQLEALRSENLDETITLLEEQKVELIPVQNIGFTYNKKDSVKDFLKWIITDGQKYNHEYGFLNIDEKTQGYQKKQLESKLLTTN